MSGMLYAEYRTLDRAAEDQRDCADRAKRIEQLRRQATIAPGALGKILPSSEIEAAFGEATAATQENLADLVELCDAVSDAVRDVKEDFARTDEQVADVFNRLRGESS
ncbi:hypothetical protein [Nocardioides limicola]|uniref:hypothetical protein n=1 Tax=Nocardioides limicola TaxID=2803368 RepID=UPI00193B924E|nr:hypothetical protein [Nocardioides sp. DJM-14]